MKLTFLGHASFRLDTPQGTVLVDPWFAGNPECPPELAAQQQDAQTILITHGHEDHFDLEFVRGALERGATLVAPTPVRRYLNTLGHKEGIQPINKGGTISVLGLDVTMTHALHHSHIETPDGPAWPHEAAGYVVRGGGTSLYFAGDTGIFGDMGLTAQIYRPQIAILPIGDRYTMGPLEAAHAVRLLGVKRVIPFHYSMGLPGTPDKLRAELDALGLVDVQVEALRAGEGVEVGG